MTVHDKRELQNIAANHSTDIDYKEFMKIDKKEKTSKPYCSLTISTTFPSDNPLCFRGNLLDLL